jgi:N-acyl-D-amino-acid deacylase
MFRRNFSLRLFGLCAVALWSVTAWSQERQYDLVIRSGRIADGTGNPWFIADIGLSGDRIAFIGQIPAGRAAREIDASGLVVAPGFIDMHSHSDRTLLTDGDAQSKIRQGVTTEILGEGSSGGPNTGQIGPINETINDERVEIESLGDFFTALEKSTISVNVASYVGINNLWRSVMGDSFETPMPEQIEQMKTLLAAAMDDGALGLSTQVMTPPGSLATTDQLVQLAKVAAAQGGIYSSHIRNEGLGVFEAVEEAITVGKEAGIPVDIIHLKIADEKYWGRMPEIVARIEQARRDGIQVQANVYPYTRGNNNLSSIIPPWAHEGGNRKLLERLKDPEIRGRLKTRVSANSREDRRNGETTMHVYILIQIATRKQAFFCRHV